MHWTGRTACLLQDALRLSNIAYAHRLGIAVRTVAAWHAMPDRIPNSEMQELLTTALEKAPQQAREVRCSLGRRHALIVRRLKP